MLLAHDSHPCGSYFLHIANNHAVASADQHKQPCNWMKLQLLKSSVSDCRPMHDWGKLIDHSGNSKSSPPLNLSLYWGCRRTTRSSQCRARISQCSERILHELCLRLMQLTSVIPRVDVAGMVHMTADIIWSTSWQQILMIDICFTQSARAAYRYYGTGAEAAREKQPWRVIQQFIYAVIL